MAIDKHRKQDSITLALVRGVNEAAVVNKTELAELIYSSNYRVSEAGDALEKRDALLQITDATQTTFGDKDIFGYHAYIDGSSNYCQLVVTEEKLWRKVAAGSWTALKTWSSTLTHQVKIHSVQDKHIVVTDSNNYCVWNDGSHGNFGITAPSTIPTLAATYNEVLLAEACAALGSWVDDDSGAGASTQGTFDSKSCFRFLNTGSSGDVASRYLDGSELGAKFAVELGVYFDKIGRWDVGDQAIFYFYRPEALFNIIIDSTGLIIKATTDEYSKESNVGWQIEEDTWYDIRLVYDGSDDSYCSVAVYIDGIYYGDYDCTQPTSSNPDRVRITLQGSTVATDVYLDYINIGDTTFPQGPMGLYRYAVTYARNSGNYPAESNPIKSIIGSPALTGAGLDDLTMTGTYTGVQDITLRIEVETAAATDIIKISYDGGTHWHLTGLPMSTIMYLQYGVELNFAATTGHTATDYWDISCDALSVLATNQKVAISSIPTSSDGQVSQRKIYRTTTQGTAYYLLAVINDNVSTSIVDNMPDSSLGIKMEEDHDVPPTGELSLWWDDRFWILDVDENILNYSQANAPEHFNLSGNAARYVSFRSGKVDDGCTGLVDFKDFLYVFKRDSIFLLRRKLTDAYSRHIVIDDVGCIAPHSIVTVQNAMFFVSERGWESFNGAELYDIEYSGRIKATMKSIDKSNAKYISSAHHKEYNEIILNIPVAENRDDEATQITAVYNYKHNCFYTFSFSKTPSCISSVRGPNDESLTVVGTRDGFCGSLDGDTKDFGATNVAALAYSGWIKTKYKWTNLLHQIIEYQAPTDIILTALVFTDFQKASVKTFQPVGVAPTGALSFFRDPNRKEDQLDLHCKYFMINFSNGEDVGSSLKIMNLEMHFQEGSFRKGDITPD